MPHFGPFELERLLGRGGMAEAFLGYRRDDPDRTPIVLKRIRPDLAKNDEYYRRFVLEAQVASRLDHPNLVRFREFGRVGQCHYIAMDQVCGFSLKRLLEPVFEANEVPSPEAALFIGSGILGGLGAMHSVTDENGSSRPMLHRDVTPANVIITHDGPPVIIDFGITKDVLGPQITLPGKVIGTMRYMAPEHRRAEYIDARADVFSASVILFELLAGRPPWPPIEGVRELLRVTFDPPEIPEDAKGRVPDEVWDVVLKGLACEAGDRFDDATAMVEALRSTSMYQQAVASGGAGAVVSWTGRLGLKADEELEHPVVDRVAENGAGVEVMWTSTGNLTTDEHRALQPSEVADADVLTIPPLPPRRDAALGITTGDLELPGGRGGWVWLAVVAAVALVGVILMVFGVVR